MRVRAIHPQFIIEADRRITLREWVRILWALRPRPVSIRIEVTGLGEPFPYRETVWLLPQIRVVK